MLTAGSKYNVYMRATPTMEVLYYIQLDFRFSSEFFSAITQLRARSWGISF
jgi:hypothetical protein